MTVEIMDTTLRDGEQTSGVSFSTAEKMTITRLLLNELHVPRIEVASARVSDGELDTVGKICAWASGIGRLEAIEVLGFLDGGQSVDWITRAGGRVINLLAKGSERHCRLQLGQTPAQHFERVAAEVNRATAAGLKVNLYLEDWSNGMKQSRDYVFAMMDALRHLPVERFMLPDTLGVLNPYDTLSYVHDMVKRYPGVRFDFHAHNDYDLATANVFAAVKGGARGVHCTVNGLGERAGNATLSSAVTVIHDQLQASTGIDESKINKVSHIVESFSGIIVPPNKPIIGESVFTQCAGVHADGDNKHKLYYNALLPERFGREREYALGKTSGKANIRKNLEALGIELPEEDIRKITERITHLGDKKEIVTQSDLPFILADVLKHSTIPSRVSVANYALNLSQGLRPTATVKLIIDGKEYQDSAAGDGQFDAFMKAVRNIYISRLGRPFPTLANYTVNIPPGGRTDALVHTVITWNYQDTVIKTRGLDADQTESAIQATVKMLNLIQI
ncbi:alpha-isopropylmalate synthase regulatory domain-containing protein [Duncaniella muricolitica]|jgi:D-citramalate synthase|uniref:alpha-isopropylmalate synthase regulatory domain-containing protein n=1 Tax=Duncaniella muricolitica TaxID=2880704 RepID=UPI00244DC561|nr:alpha-isopropylmalate synthase regulatory domain-containing protein [Duncaniella muricolitica]